MNAMTGWLINKLSMHPGKTELILFGSKSKLKKVKNFQVRFENYVTHSKTSVKCLRSNIDYYLSGDKIVRSIVQKVNNYRVRFMYRQDKYLNKSTTS